jgi:hypothetical protein
VILARAAVVGFALLACAWFALGVRQAHDITRATSIIAQTGPLTSSQGRSASSRLDSAGALNPDLEVDVLRGRLALGRGQPPAARRILNSVVHREPKNLEAWIWLARASAGSPSTFRLAVERIQTLLPHVPPPR